ncbi:MAG: anaerobic ribonucleoside-triphosphate reductase activating protein [Chloroflexi bacterium]|nr:anaerobic ribonucleoside-triphosphate reductase activating protein [Chloroflexota bacterium]
MPSKLAAASAISGIKGMVPSSMLDWEGKLVAVLFTSGCNFRCPFCHNADLVLRPDSTDDMAWERIEQHLEKRREWLDGVCITGGEPTMHPQLRKILSRIKELGFLTKLDTNGTSPEALARLIGERAVDFVAMDVKTSFDKYGDVGASEPMTAFIRESIESLVEAEVRGTIDAEFRTTFVPGIVGTEDILSVARYLGEVGASRYVIQQFNPTHVLDPRMADTKPLLKDRLDTLACECSEFLPTKAR